MLGMELDERDRELERKNMLIESLQLQLRATEALALPASDIGRPGTAASQSAEAVAALRWELRAAEAELELKDAELEACQARGPPGSDYLVLREELCGLTSDVRRLEEEHAADRRRQQQLRQHLAGLGAPRCPYAAVDARAATDAASAGAHTVPLGDSPGVGGGDSAPSSTRGYSWCQRVGVLEEEMRRKGEGLMRLREKEAWFEQQLRRQSNMNSRPLDTLLAEVLSLQEAAEYCQRRPPLPWPGIMMGGPRHDAVVTPSTPAAPPETPVLRLTASGAPAGRTRVSRSHSVASATTEYAGSPPPLENRFYSSGVPPWPAYAAAVDAGSAATAPCASGDAMAAGVPH